MRVRDALEPLLAAFDLAATEQGGVVALTGDEAPCLVLDAEALALPDGGASITRKREMDRAPSMARVRFINEGADYQTGSITVRPDVAEDASGNGDAVDLVLPAVCGPELAGRMARRALTEAKADTLIVTPGPLEALRLEIGDGVALAGEAGRWRVETVSLDETPTLTLGRVVTTGSEDAVEIWRATDAPASFGAPFFTLLDLPPLPSGEGDPRPLAAVAADPWRSMRIFAGTRGDDMTIRGEATSPACVGSLVQALAPGVTGRWDEVNAIVVKVEGAAPASLGRSAVLAGANAVAVRAGDGWEIVQFRSAELIGQAAWKLTGLLRAQQSTETEMAAGSEVGDPVVFLNEGLSRVSATISETDLPLIWRAGPAGGVPAGTGVSEQAVTLRGLYHRPWRPAHLRVSRRGAEFDIGWLPRSRLNGDVWDRDMAADPLQFRIRVLDGAVVVKTWEVTEFDAIYEASALSADFPDGPGPEVRIGVAQAGEVFGWGVEAVAALPA